MILRVNRKCPDVFQSEEMILLEEPPAIIVYKGIHVAIPQHHCRRIIDIVSGLQILFDRFEQEFVCLLCLGLGVQGMVDRHTIQVISRAQTDSYLLTPSQPVHDGTVLPIVIAVLNRCLTPA